MHVETVGLTHLYKGIAGENAALSNVDVIIKEGNWTAIIGPTGSGKSTFIQHLNGLLKPTSGNVLIGGRDIFSGQIAVREIRRTVGLVFQYPEHQIFETSVYDEIAYGPKNLGITGEELDQAVLHAAEQVGLDLLNFRDRNPHELSGGEKRKVAIAGVLAMDPKVMVFDEATAGLDPRSRNMLLAEIKRLNERGITVIWVTHNLNEVLDYADDVIVFSQGKVISVGEPMEVLSQVELLKDINLGVPQLLELEHRLKQKGFAVGKRFANLEQAADSIVEMVGGANE